MFDLCYNEGTSNITAPWCAGNTPKSLSAVGVVRYATMDNPIVAQDKRARPPADYHALAKSKGVLWLGPYTGHVTSRTAWECASGHRFKMAFYVLQREGAGCPKCKRYQPEDYRALAATFGYVWLGPEVATSAVKTRWRCGCGHEWDSTFQNLKGCPHCWHKHSGDSMRHTPADYHTLAQQHGVKWIGPEVSDIRTKTNWCCPQGHEWAATYSYMRSGYACKVCTQESLAEQRRIKPTQYHKLAAECGLVWLGPEVRAIKEKTWWECVDGHKWHATYNSLQQGQKCPECQDLVNGRRASKPQRVLCAMVGGALNYRIGRCTVDIAVFRADAKIGIEYDSYYWHAHTLDNDYRRAQYMIRRGWKILSVKGNEMLPSPEQIEVALDVLVAGEDYHELVLDDWGRGKARQ